MVLYTPKHFAQTDFQRTVSVIREMPLSTVVSSSTSYLSKETTTEISHIPFTIRSVDMDTQEMVLIGHIARANDQLAQLKETGKCHVVFQGKNDAYVSAAWYETKKIHHKVVSTWDYATVHLECEVEVVDDFEWIVGMLEETTRNYEDMRAGGDESKLIEKKWELKEAPVAYRDALIKGIAGLELRVKKIESKFKLNQNKPALDVKKILSGYAQEVGGDKAEYMTRITKSHHPEPESL